MLPHLESQEFLGINGRMLLMFGMGLGVGVLISQTLCASLLDSLEEPTMTEKMRRQVYDTLSHVISPAMLKQLQNYTS